MDFHTERAEQLLTPCYLTTHHEKASSKTTPIAYDYWIGLVEEYFDTKDRVGAV